MITGASIEAGARHSQGLLKQLHQEAERSKHPLGYWCGVLATLTGGIHQQCGVESLIRLLQMLSDTAEEHRHLRSHSDLH